jgi:integrase/recombinase XerD
MTTTALTTTDTALTTTDAMTAFGAFLRLYVADGDASPETVRSYYGNAAQFVVWCGEHGINPATVTENDIATYRTFFLAGGEDN